MESPRFVSGFDATQYVYSTGRNEGSARRAVVAHVEVLQRAWTGAPGALLGLIGPDGDLEATRLLAPRDDSGAMWCVGRHAFADIRLQNSLDAPLRGLALHVTREVMGRVRVIDLQTPTGFFVRGIGQCRDITLAGPALIEMAGYLLVVVPAGYRAFPTQLSGAFWDVLAHPRVVDAVTMGASLNDDEPVTAMRMMPNELSSAPALRMAFELTFGTSHMVSGVSPAELRRGVLCGRYNRCALGGRALHAMQRVSRVHLLLMLVDATVFGFDLATTSGTTLNGSTRRFFAIEVGDVVGLADEVRLRMVA